MRQSPPPRATSSSERAPLTPRDAYELRRWRDAHAPGRYFGEPAWDMLLQLASQADGAPVAAAELGAAVAELEGQRLRVIDQLVHDGLVAALPDAFGEVEDYVLSEAGQAFIETVFNPLTARAG